MHGRNGAWLVRLSDTTFLVKPFASAFYCAREAQNLQRLRASAHVRVPALRVAERTLLVTSTSPELVVAGTRARCQRLRTWEIDALGRALGSLHRATASDRDIPPLGLMFDPRLSGADVVNESAGIRGLLLELQADKESISAIEELARSLPAQAAALVHGDVRAANLLVPRPSRCARRQLWLVDWELAGRGDPAMDVGAAIALLLEAAIRSTGVGPDRRGIAQFLAAYSGANGPPSLSRAIRLAGLRLLQLAVEAAANGRTAYVRRIVEIGRLLLTRPAEAAIHLHVTSVTSIASLSRIEQQLKTTEAKLAFESLRSATTVKRQHGERTIAWFEQSVVPFSVPERVAVLSRVLYRYAYTRGTPVPIEPPDGHQPQSLPELRLLAPHQVRWRRNRGGPLPQLTNTFSGSQNLNSRGSAYAGRTS